MELRHYDINPIGKHYPGRTLRVPKHILITPAQKQRSPAKSQSAEKQQRAGQRGESKLHRPPIRPIKTKQDLTSKKILPKPHLRRIPAKNKKTSPTATNQLNGRPAIHQHQQQQTRKSRPTTNANNKKLKTLLMRK